MILTPGAKIEETHFGPITLDHLKAYAEVSGDFNPIHTDETAAKSVGLPGVIAHGMLSAGLVADRALDFAGERKLHSYQTRFKGMVFLSDTITISGSVKNASEQALTLDLVAKNQSGLVVTLAVAEFR